MNITDLFIRRPVMTTLVMLSLLVFGVVAYRSLPVSDLPNVDFPTINVTANLPGASPDTMASAVATPLERQFSTISGIDSMNSTSTLGITTITIVFALDRDIDAAAQDVQAAIAKTLPLLPNDLLPPSYQKVNPADQPILFYSLTSKTLPLSDLDEYGQTLLSPRMSMVEGVAQVAVYGSQKYAVRIQLDPNELASRGIGLDQVAAAVQNSNVNIPTGTLWGNHQAFTIETNGGLGKAEEFRHIVVISKNGSTVHLGDLGQVKDDVQNNKVAAWLGNTRAVMLAVQRQPGTNTVQVAADVRSVVDKLRSQVPGAAEITLLFDRSEAIRDSVHDVKFTLLLALMLVVLVIFLFLRNARATIIPSLALPMSLIGTFMVMYVLGYSLDNLSLMALTLSVGFVVDDAIVMLENIVRHMEMGKKPFQAALDGAREIGFTILSMTVSLVAVFIPLLFMGGIIGRLFHEFAVTISAAILASGFISLTLTPMLGSRFLRHSGEVHHNRVFIWSERLWDRTSGFYASTLERVMRHRPIMVIFSAVVLIATGYLFVTMPKGFLPSNDIGMIQAVSEAAEGTSFESMVDYQKKLADVLAADPNVDNFMSAVGAGGPTSIGNQGRFFLRLKDLSQRKLNADQIVERLRPKMNAMPGMRVFLMNPPPIRIGGMFTKAAYAYTMQSTDTRALYDAAPKFEAAARALPGLQDVTSDLLIRSPQVIVNLDREKAAALGISSAQVDGTLSLAFSSMQVSTILTPTNQYWVVLEFLPEYQRDIAALSALYVRGAGGVMVPLSAIAEVRRGVGPLVINHYGQVPAVSLSFNLRPGIAIGDAVTEVEKLARDLLPASITTNFTGTAQAFKSSQGNLGTLLILAILVIYIILGILYESFVHPLTILSGLPFAGFGALVTLLIFHAELNVYSYVGIIMLIGVVKKNAIMMIDFAQGAQHAGANARDAVLQAAHVRFRPIMMTTVAAFMGTLPIALGFGAGAESRQPLGLAVVGGLAFSQLVTLYVTPVFYTYFDGLQRRVTKLFAS